MIVLIDHHFEIHADGVRTDKNAATLFSVTGWDAEERSRLAVVYPGSPRSTNDRGEMTTVVPFRSLLITNEAWATSTRSKFVTLGRRLGRRLRLSNASRERLIAVCALLSGALACWWILQ